jgi:hypothetical protein
VIQHGTNAGYQAHRAAGEDACQPCLDAHAELARNVRLAGKPDGFSRRLAQAINRLLATGADGASIALHQNGYRINVRIDKETE